MGQVNRRRESGPSERDFEPPALAQGAQPAAKNGRIPGLQRPDRRAERVSPKGILAEGEELWSNILFVKFQWVRIPHHPMNLWRTADSPRYPVRGLQDGLRSGSRAATPTSWCAAIPPCVGRRRSAAGRVASRHGPAAGPRPADPSGPPRGPPTRHHRAAGPPHGQLVRIVTPVRRNALKEAAKGWVRPSRDVHAIGDGPDAVTGEHLPGRRGVANRHAVVRRRDTLWV